MKAIILAAGKGERLKEITQNIPKPMIKFKGKPLLQHNIELCRKYGIKDIFINLHHLPEKIKDYFGSGERFGVNIKYSYEEKLLGTAGAVKKIVQDFFDNSFTKSQSKNITKSFNLFFVIYGDNYSEYDLNLLIDKQKQTNTSCLIAFHYREDISHSGVAEFDNDNKITRFIEKPKESETKSRWVNAGIYFLSTEILKFIGEGNVDFGKDVFPKILNNNIPIYGVCSNTEVRAFDNLKMFNHSMKEAE